MKMKVAYPNPENMEVFLKMRFMEEAMMESVMVTFDAIRGLPSEMAERVSQIIWDAAKRDQVLREALEDATLDFLRWESEQSARMAGWTAFQNERGMDYCQGQDDQLLADIPW